MWSIIYSVTLTVFNMDFAEMEDIFTYYQLNILWYSVAIPSVDDWQFSSHVPYNVA